MIYLSNNNNDSNTQQLKLSNPQYYQSNQNQAIGILTDIIAANSSILAEVKHEWVLVGNQVVDLKSPSGTDWKFCYLPSSEQLTK